jgi:hypothetical protein
VIPPQGNVELALPPRAAPVVWAGIVGALHGVAALRLATIAWPSPLEAEQAVMGALVGAALAAAAVWVVNQLRAVPSGALTWDEERITEWAGTEPVTILARSEARCAVQNYSVVYRSGSGNNLGRESGTVLQLSDPAGKTITLCEGVVYPPWLGNRPSHVDSIMVLRGLAPPLEPMSIVPDALGFGRTGRLGFGFVALCTYAAFVGAAASANWNTSRSDRGLACVIIWAGCVLSLVRMVWPFRKRATRLRRSVLVELGLRAALAVLFLSLSLAVFWRI